MTVRKQLRCIIVEPGQQTMVALCTGIAVNVPDGLTRQEAIDYVTGVITREVSRYAASEALGLGSIDRETDWSEKVT